MRNTIYTLKVILRDVQPSVWRRLEVPASITLARLHEIVQIAMPWEDGHLHLFQIGAVRYGAFHNGVPDVEDDPDLKDEAMVKLAQVVEPGSLFLYEYDFGDGWEHDIMVQEADRPRPGVDYPICTGGARACPPENCGGAGGYEDLIVSLRDAGHEDYVETKQWLGGYFDPEGFDANAVNRGLRSLAP